MIGVAARLRRWIVPAVAFAATAGVAFGASGQALLDVPYLAQSEDLCGGASAAMVMRYWGDDTIYPDAFAPLIDRAAGGIHTSALVAALEQRGWVAAAGPGDAAGMARELGRGRPVIALIEDRPGIFHYVVVIARTSAEVVVHDPARAPSRVLPAAKFDAAWAKTRHWMLILLPPAGAVLHAPSRTAGANPRRTDLGEGACDTRVAEAVTLAGTGDRVGARRTLEQAISACPRSPGAWRELAGLDALQNAWDASAAHAARAVALDPDDPYAWRLLATARYLLHDDVGALAAWNHLGEPTVNLIDVTGLEHTRYQVVADAIGVDLQAVLSPRALRLAARRVHDIPSIAVARVAFQPVENGEARIEASVLERERAPSTYPSWLAMGVKAATDRELASSVTNLTGGGDALALTWRWWAHRPMLAAAYSAPAPRAIGGGIWTVDASRETQTFAGAAGISEEVRSRAGLTVSNWVTERARVGGGLAIESWSGRGREAALSGHAEFWPIVERLEVAAGATGWIGGGRFATAQASARWWSSPGTTGTVWVADGGYRVASGASPRSIWPGAGTGHARDVLLRAHPLLDGGVIRDGVFGRHLVFANLEVQRWFPLRRLPIRLGPAAFVDSARASGGDGGRAQFDAGAGLRVAIPGMGVIRLDLARGLRDGRTALSVGWTRR